MTTKEFKDQNPKYAHLEGDELYDAMTVFMIKQQNSNEIIKQIKPFWKTHTLRWLFYRRKKNYILVKNGWASTQMCSVCKKGVSNYMSILFFLNDGKTSMMSSCPCCKKPLVRVKNTTLIHKLYILSTKSSSFFWMILDKLHIVRSSHDDRYGMFGDERKYVKSWEFNKTTGKSTTNLKSRKWWEYIFIEKSTFNF